MLSIQYTIPQNPILTIQALNIKSPRTAHLAYEVSPAVIGVVKAHHACHLGGEGAQEARMQGP